MSLVPNSQQQEELSHQLLPIKRVLQRGQNESGKSTKADISSENESITY